MSDEDDDNTVNLVVQDEGQRIVVDFLKRDPTYDKLLKSLDKASGKAIEKLVELMTTSNDEKIVASCAKSILELQVSVSKEKTGLELQKLILHARQLSQGSGGMKQLVNADEDKPKRPIVDFSQVRQIG